MRNCKKYIQCFVLLLPMLVLLGHDIIPHHHHEHEHACEQYLLHATTTDQLLADTTQEKNKSNRIQEHSTPKTSCCFSVTNRVQKELKYQIFLQAYSISLNYEAARKIQKFRITNFRLIPESFQLPSLRRGPPFL